MNKTCSPPHKKEKATRRRSSGVKNEENRSHPLKPPVGTHWHLCCCRRLSHRRTRKSSSWTSGTWSEQVEVHFLRHRRVVKRTCRTSCLLGALTDSATPAAVCLQAKHFRTKRKRDETNVQSLIQLKSTSNSFSMRKTSRHFHLRVPSLFFGQLAVRFQSTVDKRPRVISEHCGAASPQLQDNLFRPFSAASQVAEPNRMISGPDYLFLVSGMPPSATQLPSNPL